MSDLEVGELTGAASYRPPRRGPLSDFGRARAGSRWSAGVRMPWTWATR